MAIYISFGNEYSIKNKNIANDFKGDWAQIILNHLTQSYSTFTLTLFTQNNFLLVWSVPHSGGTVQLHEYKTKW